MKPAITVSLVPQVRNGPFVFTEGLAHACANAASLGFAAIEIFPADPGSIDQRELAALLAAHSLRVAAVGTGAGWIVHRWHLCDGDAAVRERAKEFIFSVIDFAAAFDAPAIVGSMQGRVEADLGKVQAIDCLGAALEECSKRAGQHRQRLLLEPLNRYETNLLTTLGEAGALLDALGADNLKLLADLFHMNIEEASIPEALRAAGTRLGHVHFADSNRRAIGFGHTAIDPIIETLREIGYDGYLSAEIFPHPDAMNAARQTMVAFERCIRTT